MSYLKLSKSNLKEGKITISGSKSESNRMLILQKLFGNIEFENLSNSEDTQLLQKALEQNSGQIFVNHSGTAMRFLTSFFSIQENSEVILTGSERLCQRPIKPLVEALRELGADISYLKNEDFPPLKIKGKKLTQNEVDISAEISSQFISSLILIAGKLENGLEINLVGNITSRPYLEMTLEMLKSTFPNQASQIIFQGNKIIIPKIFNHQSKTFDIESDWSSASYFYSLCAIGRKKISLKSFRQNSFQGDRVITKLFQKYFGVTTKFNSQNQEISLIPIENFKFPNQIVLNMNDCPDIAQTLCVTASSLKIPFEISGLKTLKIKETDRILSLQNELMKIGAKTEISNDNIILTTFAEPNPKIQIKTYNDHRMAMAFAPFSLVQELEIENPDVVEKSYPNFWSDFNLITKS